MTHNLFFAVPACVAAAGVFVCTVIVVGSKTISWFKKPTKGSSYEDKMEYIKKTEQAGAEYVEMLAR